MRRTVPALAALALVLALTGCHPPTPGRVREWPDTRPVFSSEEEALAAAEEAYGEYLAVSDAITEDGGAKPERILGLVTAERRPAESESFEAFSSEGLRTVGTTTFDSVVLQQFHDNSDGAIVEIYLCVDVSNVRIVDESGTDVTPAGRQNRVPLEVGFMTLKPDVAMLLFRNDVYEGGHNCAG